PAARGAGRRAADVDRDVRARVRVAQPSVPEPIEVPETWEPLDGYFCFATILSLIFAYTPAGSTFFETRSFFRLYGRPLMILSEYAVPMPGKASSSCLLAVLMSTRSVWAPFWPAILPGADFLSPAGAGAVADGAAVGCCAGLACAQSPLAEIAARSEP